MRGMMYESRAFKELVYKLTSRSYSVREQFAHSQRGTSHANCWVIAEFGFTNPILIDEKGVVIAGHGRVQTAQKLKPDRGAVHYPGRLTEGGEENLCNRRQAGNERRVGQ